ncbi:hypothetical protein, partial [Oceanithermus sp.]
MEQITRWGHGNIFRIILLSVLGLLLAGCPSLLENNLPNRTPIATFYPFAGGIDVIDPQHLLRGRYLLFTNASNTSQQVAFDLIVGQLVWQTTLFPNSTDGYFLGQNNRYAYAWPPDYLAGELVVLDPKTGRTLARLSDPQLEEGARVLMYNGITASDARVYAISGRSGVAVFDLDDAGLPTFARKITIPDVESVTTPTRGQLFYVMS